jgi:two-component system, OmpR family, phosphate regulon sensor histidine kinase PhoR
MAYRRKYNTQQLAIIISAIVFLFSAVISIILVKKWQAVLGLSFCLSILVYFLVRYFFEQYVDNRIKLIYKSIYQTKATKKQNFYTQELLPKKQLYQVEEEVKNWQEEEVEQQKQITANENYRKEFLQSLSHELKTPIFSIQGYIENLQDGAINNPQLAERFLQNAHRNILRLSELLQDLDEITKLETGLQIIELTKHDIVDAIDDVKESLLLQLQQKNILVAWKDSSLKQAYAMIDKPKIKQVLLNLFENAIKYGKQSGNIWLSVQQTDDEHYLIEMEDNGEGIAENHLNRLFERFYRTDTARSRNIAGSGLGLAICKHIVEAHGQHINVRSKLNVGSTFGFTLQKA